MRRGARQGIQGQDVPGGVTLKGGWPEVWRANLEIRGASPRHRAHRRLPGAAPGPARQARARFSVGRRAAPGRALPRRGVMQRFAHLSLGGGGAAHRDGRSPRSWARPRRPRPRCASGRASRRTCAASASIRRASCCTSAATSRPSPRRPCARPWRRCSCASAGLTAASRWSIRCADRARSSSRRRRSPRGCSRAARGTSPSSSWRASMRRPGKRMRAAHAPVTPAVRFYGSDRDAGAIRMSRANAERAGVAGFTEFHERAIEDLAAPPGPPGPRHRQPAVRRPHRREGARRAALSHARAHAADEVRRLARGSDHE